MIHMCRGASSALYPVKVRPENPPFLPYKIDGKFYNFHELGELETPESFMTGFKQYFGSFRNFMKVPKNKGAWIQKDVVTPTSQNFVSTWLGHATVLMQVAGINILTDPLFGSPTFLYRRLTPLGIDKKDLPKIDVVLISHNHKDHFDDASLLYLQKHYNPLFLVPEGDKQWFINHGCTHVEEFMWWDTYRYNADVQFTFVPSWHWSQHGLFDHNRSIWGGWVIEAGGLISYFAGDTAYNQHYFKTIGNYFKHIDIAFLPIGPGDPDEWWRKSHINAQEAGKACVDCRAKILVPVHWGTFYIGKDDFERPVQRLKDWWSEHQNLVQGTELRFVKIGQRVQYGIFSDKNEKK